MFLDLTKPKPGQWLQRGTEARKGRGGRRGVEMNGICGYGSSAAHTGAGVTVLGLQWPVGMEAFPKPRLKTRAHP